MKKGEISVNENEVEITEAEEEAETETTKTDDDLTESYAADMAHMEDDSDRNQHKIILIERPSRIISGIWDYFGIAEKENATSEEKMKNEADRLICLLCYNNGRIHVYMKSTSSGNLWRHLNRVHNIPIPTTDRTKRKNLKRKRNSLTNNTDPQKIDCDNNVDVSSVCQNVKQQNTLEIPLCSRINSKDIGSLLISEIAKRPQLYLRGQYKRATKEELWKEIHAALGKVVEIDNLQKTWKNIRDRYKKLKKSNSSVDLTRYKYYHQLKFLDKCSSSMNDNVQILDSMSRNKDPVEIMYCEEMVKNETINEDELIIENDDDYYDDDDDDDDNDYENDNYDDKSPPSKIEKLNSQENTHVDENKTGLSYYEIINEEVITDNEDPATLNNELSSENKISCDCQCSTYDEFDLFGKFIAEKLRKLPKCKSDNVEIEIMKILKDEI